MSLRLSLRSILILDAPCVTCLLLLGLPFPATRQGTAHPPAIILDAFLHALIAPVKGLDFVIWDALPDSFVKLYRYMVIAFSKGGGLVLRNAVWEYGG